MTTVADLTALEALDITLLFDGVSVWVTSEAASYYLSKTSTLPINSPEVVQTSLGPLVAGRWILGVAVGETCNNDGAQCICVPPGTVDGSALLWSNEIGAYWLPPGAVGDGLVIAASGLPAYTPVVPNLCILGVTAGQAFTAAGGEEPATWDVEVYDPFGMHSGANPTRVNILRTGRYRVMVNIRAPAVAGTNFYIVVIRTRGGAPDPIGYVGCRGGGVVATPTGHSLGFDCALILGDYLEAAVNTEADFTSIVNTQEMTVEELLPAG